MAVCLTKISYCLCRKAVKATLILLPLLGVTHVLLITPPGDTTLSKNIFVYFNAVLQSTQVRRMWELIGILVIEIKSLKSFFPGVCGFNFESVIFKCFEIITFSYLSSAFALGEWCTTLLITSSQRARDAIITFSRRRRRRVDVVKTLSLRHYCVMCPLGSQHWFM